jgi:hypothetical protein
MLHLTTEKRSRVCKFTVKINASLKYGFHQSTEWDEKKDYNELVYM